MANAVGTYGTSKRNGYSMPDIDNIDFGFYKNFPFGEQRNLQIRFAGFNLFNHATLGLSNTTASSANFGLMTYQRNSPRILQIGAKISF